MKKRIKIWEAEVIRSNAWLVIMDIEIQLIKQEKLKGVNEAQRKKLESLTVLLEHFDGLAGANIMLQAENTRLNSTVLDLLSQVDVLKKEVEKYENVLREETEG